MPELPEVERARRLIERVARGRRITRVTCARDAIVFDGVSGLRLRRVVTGRTVVGVARRGKHLWLELDRRPWPCFHLGMTGAFHTPGETPLKLASSPAVEELSWPPRFTKIRLVLDGGGELAMTNKRRLGRIRLRNDPPGEAPISRLGFDPLLDFPPPARFLELVANRSTSIKALLLDPCVGSSSMLSKRPSGWMRTSRGFLATGSFIAGGSGIPRQPPLAETASST